MHEDENEKSDRIADLLAKFMRGNLSTEESEELNAWLEEDPKNKELFTNINDPKWQKRSFDFFDNIDHNSAWDAVSIRIEKDKRDNIHQGGKRIKKYLLAASILIILLTAGTFLLYTHGVHVEKSPFGQEIMPGSMRATLFLQGKKIEVSSAKSEEIEKGITNQNGWIIYESDKMSSEEHKLIVPNGGTYAVKLQDGTSVWLNAGSSLRFPSKFTGTERLVELVGEGFFSVAKDAVHPFKVLCQGTETQAIGTEFNVNGYGNKVTTTLIEGKVKVLSPSGNTYLIPGQSSTFNSLSMPLAVQSDTALATGWKNGNFVFLHTDFQEVMDQLSHWYGVEIKYSKGFEPNGLSFTGELSRNKPISQLLSLMEMTGIASFKVSDKILYVDTATRNTGR